MMGSLMFFQFIRKLQRMYKRLCHFLSSAIFLFLFTTIAFADWKYEIDMTNHTAPVVKGITSNQSITLRQGINTFTSSTIGAFADVVNQITYNSDGTIVIAGTQNQRKDVFVTVTSNHDVVLDNLNIACLDAEIIGSLLTRGTTQVHKTEAFHVGKFFQENGATSFYDGNYYVGGRVHIAPSAIFYSQDKSHLYFGEMNNRGKICAGQLILTLLTNTYLGHIVGTVLKMNLGDNVDLNDLLIYAKLDFDTFYQDGKPLSTKPQIKIDQLHTSSVTRGYKDPKLFELLLQLSGEKYGTWYRYQVGSSKVYVSQEVKNPLDPVITLSLPLAKSPGDYYLSHQKRTIEIMDRRIMGSTNAQGEVWGRVRRFMSTDGSSLVLAEVNNDRDDKKDQEELREQIDWVFGKLCGPSLVPITNDLIAILQLLPFKVRSLRTLDGKVRVSFYSGEPPLRDIVSPFNIVSSKKGEIEKGIVELPNCVRKLRKVKNPREIETLETLSEKIKQEFRDAFNFCLPEKFLRLCDRDAPDQLSYWVQYPKIEPATKSLTELMSNSIKEGSTGVPRMINVLGRNLARLQFQNHYWKDQDLFVNVHGGFNAENIVITKWSRNGPIEFTLQNSKSLCLANQASGTGGAPLTDLICLIQSACLCGGTEGLAGDGLKNLKELLTAFFSGYLQALPTKMSISLKNKIGTQFKPTVSEAFTEVYKDICLQNERLYQDLVSNKAQILQAFQAAIVKAKTSKDVKDLKDLCYQYLNIELMYSIDRDHTPVIEALRNCKFPDDFSEIIEKRFELIFDGLCNTSNKGGKKVPLEKHWGEQHSYSKEHQVRITHGGGARLVLDVLEKRKHGYWLFNNGTDCAYGLQVMRLKRLKEAFDIVDNLRWHYATSKPQPYFDDPIVLTAQVNVGSLSPAPDPEEAGLPYYNLEHLKNITFMISEKAQLSEATIKGLESFGTVNKLKYPSNIENLNRFYRTREEHTKWLAEQRAKRTG